MAQCLCLQGLKMFSRVLTALCFCVVWMCCDFQGLIAFLYPVRWRGRQHPLCSFDTGPVSFSLQQYSVLCRGATGGLPNAHLLPLEFILTKMMAGSPSSDKNCMLCSKRYFNRMYLFYIFETIFYIQDFSTWGSSHCNQTLDIKTWRTSGGCNIAKLDKLACIHNL